MWCSAEQSEDVFPALKVWLPPTLQKVSFIFDFPEQDTQLLVFMTNLVEVFYAVLHKFFLSYGKRSTLCPQTELSSKYFRYLLGCLLTAPRLRELKLDIDELPILESTCNWEETFCNKSLLSRQCKTWVQSNYNE